MALATRLRSASHWSDPRVKPPYGAAEMDWGHPLARGLSAAWVFNVGAGTGVVDFVRRWPGTLVGTPPAWGTSAGGLGVVMNGVSGSDRMEAGDIPFDNDNWTLAVSLTAGASLDGAYRRLIGWDQGPGVSGPLIWRATDASLWAIVHGNTIDLSTATGVPAANERFSAAIARQGVSNAWLVKNGVVQVSSASFSATYTLTGNTFRVGTGHGNAENFPGTFDYAYAWGTRGLSTDNLAWLHAEPYTVLRPIIRRRYFIFTAAPAEEGDDVVQEHIGRGLSRGVFLGR